MRKAVTDLLHSSRAVPPPESAVLKAAKRVATVARKDGLQAEQMIVLLKKEWVEVTGSMRRVADDPLKEIQTRLISESIRTYYALSDGNGP